MMRDVVKTQARTQDLLDALRLRISNRMKQRNPARMQARGGGAFAPYGGPDSPLVLTFYFHCGFCALTIEF